MNVEKNETAIVTRIAFAYAVSWSCFDESESEMEHFNKLFETANFLTI